MPKFPQREARLWVPLMAIAYGLAIVAAAVQMYFAAGLACALGTLSAFRS